MLAKTALVLHEYLGIMHGFHIPFTDDSHYQISHFVYDHPALKLNFDNSETAQSLNDVAFDFPVKCSLQYQNQPMTYLATLGQYYTMGNVETHTMMFMKNISKNDKSKKNLEIVIFDESDEMSASTFRASPHKKASLRIMVGWTKNGFESGEIPSFDQSILLSPNFQFSVKIQSLNIALECHRTSLRPQKKTIDFDP